MENNDFKEMNGIIVPAASLEIGDVIRLTEGWSSSYLPYSVQTITNIDTNGRPTFLSKERKGPPLWVDDTLFKFVLLRKRTKRADELIVGDLIRLSTSEWGEMRDKEVQIIKFDDLNRPLFSLEGESATFYVDNEAFGFKYVGRLLPPPLVAPPPQKKAKELIIGDHIRLTGSAWQLAPSWKLFEEEVQITHIENGRPHFQSLHGPVYVDDDTYSFEYVRPAIVEPAPTQSIDDLCAALDVAIKAAKDAGREDLIDAAILKNRPKKKIADLKVGDRIRLTGEVWKKYTDMFGLEVSINRTAPSEAYFSAFNYSSWGVDDTTFEYEYIGPAITLVENEMASQVMPEPSFPIEEERADTITEENTPADLTYIVYADNQEGDIETNPITNEVGRISEFMSYGSVLSGRKYSRIGIWSIAKERYINHIYRNDNGVCHRLDGPAYISLHDNNKIGKLHHINGKFIPKDKYDNHPDIVAYRQSKIEPDISWSSLFVAGLGALVVGSMTASKKQAVVKQETVKSKVSNK